MIKRIFLMLAVFASLAIFSNAVLADPVWEVLPDIYPGEFAYLRVEAASSAAFQAVAVTVSNATGEVTSQNAMPFGTDQLCGKFTTTLLLISTGDVPTSAFSTSGTYFVTVAMSFQTNYFQQVVKPFQAQRDEQAFQNLPDGVILKTILLSGAAECEAQDVHAVQQFLTNYPSAYYATYARSYLAGCRLYTEMAGNPADPFHEPDPTQAIADLEAIQGAEGLCRGKILFDRGYGYWKKQNLAQAKPLLESVINDFPATPWAAAAREMLGLKMDGIVAWYPLNEGQGLLTTNLVCGGPSGQLAGSSLPVWGSGTEGNALQFDGNGYVTVPTNAAWAVLSNRVTLTAWVKAGTNASGSVISKVAAGGGFGSFALSLTNGAVAFKLFLRGTPTQVVSTNVLPDSLWHHLAGVYNGQSLKVYLNGEEVSSVTATGAVDVVSEPLLLGRNSDGAGLVGTIDEVRIYGRALSDGDVADLFNLDTDADGLSNAQEANQYGTNPAATDTDGDGLSDGDEVGIHHTNPNAADSDGDGVNDYVEIWERGTDPNNAQSVNITLYANSQIGSNGFDGLSATVTNSHGPKLTIQAAITTGISGDTVEIAGEESPYTESTLDPGAKNLTLRPCGNVTISP